MKRKKKVGLIFIALIFIIMIIFGIYKILSVVYDYKEGDEVYNYLEEFSKLDEMEEDVDNILWPVVDFEELKRINEDIVAWISIDNLDINYPIVQGDDNDYYLNHLADGSYNGLGSIFMDYRNQTDLNDKHTVIYGHNIKNGTMFSNLTKYKEQEYYDNNPYYTLVTEERNYVVEIIAGYVTDVNDNSWDIDFSNDWEFEKWIGDTIDKSLFKSKTIPSVENNIITLSTCDYEFDNARFVLVGILLEQ